MLLRLIVFTHRWLGIFGCLLFTTWFASGIVMMYARMPRLTPVERAALLPQLDFTQARLSPGEAAGRHHLSPQRVIAGMLEGRPVYRVLSDGRWTVVFADTGERFDGFTAERALAEARRLARRNADSLQYDARIAEPDQWTLQARALLPMHRIDVGDPAGSVLYLSDVSGEVAQKTTARERRVAYAGAVLHWLYFTPLRKHGPLWNQTIVWLSAAGSVMCLLGLVWGVYLGLRTPYRGWMQWHHYAGLAFGVVSFTWVFSGLLSMDPVPAIPGNAPTRAERERFSGPLRLDGVTVDMFRGRSREAQAAPLKEIEVTQFRGATRLIVDDWAGMPVDDAALVAAARETVPGAALEDVTALEAYDAYYYDRSGELRLPVLRIRFSDPSRTWLYVDPARGAILRKEVRLSRVNRWLYHGLHSLDFPWLYNRRPLWDVVVILLSLGGMASAVTSLAPAWRRLRRHAQHPYT